MSKKIIKEGIEIIHHMSGSRGNCFQVKTDIDIVIDTNVSRLPCELLLVTHTHVDHFKNFKYYIRKCKAWHTTPEVYEDVLNKIEIPLIRDMAKSKYLSSDEVDVLGISSYPVIHDVPCAAFKIEYNGYKYAHITDTPKISSFLPFIDCDYYSIESNYDKFMIRNSKRPAFVTNRTMTVGHMSNEYSAKFISFVAGPNTKQISFIHMSKDNNDLDIAKQTHKRILKDEYELIYPEGVEKYGTKITNVPEEKCKVENERT